mmetsp:Transcript_29500/g.68010  ORF Transcript_29500/g.68010 Transcript_29500/m.68010 type:complete len:214 (+) Transcript_29500:566-1207(+)
MRVSVTLRSFVSKVNPQAIHVALPPLVWFRAVLARLVTKCTAKTLSAGLWASIICLTICRRLKAMDAYLLDSSLAGAMPELPFLNLKILLLLGICNAGLIAFFQNRIPHAPHLHNSRPLPGMKGRTSLQLCVNLIELGTTQHNLFVFCLCPACQPQLWLVTEWATEAFPIVATHIPVTASLRWPLQPRACCFRLRCLLRLGIIDTDLVLPMVD